MPISLDRRTRLDADRGHVTPESFFVENFPKLTMIHGHLVASGMAELAAPALSIEVGNDTWTVFRDGDTVAVRPGLVHGAMIVTLSEKQFSDWVQNQMTFNGFLVTRTLEFRNGSVCDISAWDSLWICLLEGWPVGDVDLALVDRAGAPLNLRTRFTPQDNPQDIAHFLREAGYLHLRGWLAPYDMTLISAEMDEALSDYFEGDGKSWWATLADGSRQCVRLQEFVERSPTTRRILLSDGWENLRRVLAGDDDFARKSVEGRLIEALIKPVGVIAGPSDLSFHRDCHLGRHSYVCSRMTLGIALTPTSAANGLLQVVAGSHRVAMPVEVAKSRPYLPVVDLPTSAGDITVHLSCTLHASTPPISAERRVLYTEIPLVAREGRDVYLDTSVGEVRERVSDLHRPEEAS